MATRKQLEWLKGELAAWEKEGLINAGQVQRVLARPLYLQALSRAPSRTLTRLFAVLGALLVGVGLILFFSSNWRAIPDEGKLGLVFGSIVGAYGLAARLRFGPRPLPSLAAGLFLLGAIAFGAGIFLVAQIYNIHADWRTGILLWFMGTLPLAYAVDSRPVLWLSLGTLFLWLGTEFGFWQTTILYQILGGILVLVAVRHWHPLRLPRFAKIYFVIGSGAILSTSLFMTFGNNVEALSAVAAPRELGSYLGTHLGLYVALLLLTICTGQGLIDTARHRLVVLLSISLAPAILLWCTPRIGTPYLLLTNLLVFGECLGLILFGVALRSKLYLNLGISFFLVLVLCRYFDSYWEYLPRSLFFVFGGLLLLVLGYLLEKKRRTWIAQWETGVAG